MIGFCKNGHEKNDENYCFNPNNKNSYCRVCNRLSKKRSYRRSELYKNAKRRPIGWGTVQHGTAKCYTYRKCRCEKCRISYREFDNNRYKSKEHKYEDARKISLKSLYNLTLEQFESMLIEQEYKCYICDTKHSTTKKLNVDHDHKTNKIRGLLCSRCNLALGMFRDDVEILTNATNYLKKHAIISI